MNIFYYLILLISFVNAQIDDGLYLFSPVISLPEDNQVYKTILMDTTNTIINEWSHDCSPSSTPYLQPDSTLLRPCKLDPPLFDEGGVGGLLQLIDWHGNIMWQANFSSENNLQHHDIEPLANGNILLLLWERKNQAQVLSKGKINHTGELWVEKIIEIDPLENNTYDTIWEWSLWDYLIQDVDSSLSNFMTISDNPQYFNINYLQTSNEGPGPPQLSNPDFLHVNAIDYNEQLHQISFSSRKSNEIYIINHFSDTEQQNQRNTGLIYRWGNTSVYNQGNASNQFLYAPHGVNFISNDQIAIFNNGFNRPGGNYSSVEVITLPALHNSQYSIDNSGIYPPNQTFSTFNLNEEYYTSSQGGAFKLDNGNILVTISNMKKILEVNTFGNIVYEYYYEGNGNIPRCQKYNYNYFNAILGDINLDNTIDVMDIIECINLILSSNYNNLSDLNQDNYIDILDIVLIVNIIID